MNVSVAVQHHPSRAALITPLLARLPAGTTVVEDPNPDSPKASAFRSYLRALRETPEDATHRLIVQDDAWPCRDFWERATAALAEKPDDMVAFFAPGAGAHRSRVQRAIERGETWALLHSMWYPTVALCWPVRRVADFLAWCSAERLDPEMTTGDDGPVGAFCQRTRVPVWATVPSLVEHPDVVPSLYGRVNRAGDNRARVAWAYADR